VSKPTVFCDFAVTTLCVCPDTLAHPLGEEVVMLFLYRPRQTWLPMPLPQNLATNQQRAYNVEMQQRFDATRRVEPAPPAAVERDPVEALQRLGALYEAGTLTADEFAAAKAKVLGTA
jgi:hypothetical protein